MTYMRRSSARRRVFNLGLRSRKLMNPRNAGFAMKQAAQSFRRFKFGVFEADLRTGELTKLGKRVRLQEQPFQLLAMLLERPRELVIREELRERLWPKTIVEF